MFEKNALNGDFKDSLFVEGYFETEKYFIKYANEIKNEFIFKNKDLFKNNPLYKDIKIQILYLYV